MKQYTIKPAYTGNSKIDLYENGKLVSTTIDNDYNLGGHINAIEDMGYERAYDVDEAEKKMLDAKQKYEWALEEYEYAKAHALIKSK